MDGRSAAGLLVALLAAAALCRAAHPTADCFRVEGGDTHLRPVENCTAVRLPLAFADWSLGFSIDAWNATGTSGGFLTFGSCNYSISIGKQVVFEDKQIDRLSNGSVDNRNGVAFLLAAGRRVPVPTPVNCSVGIRALDGGRWAADVAVEWAEPTDGVLFAFHEATPRNEQTSGAGGAWTGGWTAAGILVGIAALLVG
ncbi:hypothetical protein M3Y99_00237400 [Aphelenchoides fujianensis]|nr:hypothetical protein M3Y99_00237400 [Aphelenchoides fujianensis]